MKILQTTFLGLTDWSKNMDKVYKVCVIQDGNQYGIHKLSGRRNGTLVDQGKKWFSHIAIAQAEANKVIKAKEKKGYSIEEQTTPESRFSDEYIGELITKAGVLCAEEMLERNHYQNLKALLNSKDEKNMTMAESIIESKEKQKSAA